MHKFPLPVDQQCLEIIVWITSFVAGRSVADQPTMTVGMVWWYGGKQGAW